MKRLTRKERKRFHQHDFKYNLIWIKNSIPPFVSGCDCGAIIGQEDTFDIDEAKEILDRLRF